MSTYTVPLDAPGGIWGAYQRSLNTAQMEIVKPPPVPVQQVPEDPMDPLFGVLLLTAVDEWFAYYARYPGIAYRHRVLGWAFHTHLRDVKTGRLLVSASPRLGLLSKEGTSGKSTVLELLNLVCAYTDGLSVEPTEPAVRSMLGSENLTLLLDESDILFGTGRRKEAIRAILNASTYPNGHVDRIQGGTRVKEMVFGPVAFAALAKLKHSTGGMLETLFQRTIEVFMSPPNEDIPDILDDEEGQQLGRDARKLIALWTQLHLEEILAAIRTVQLPPGIKHRQAQIWRPLLAIFEVAGGPWPEHGYNACIGKQEMGTLASFTEGVQAL
jgi:Protein of unknown function (DUF3631)